MKGEKNSRLYYDKNKMILYSLLIIETILLNINIRLFKKDLLSPNIVLNSTLLVVIIVNILNIENWRINFSVNTFIIIIFSQLFFFVGSILSYVIRIPTKKKEKIYEIKFRQILIVTIILIILNLYVFFKIYFALDRDLTNFLERTRYLMLHSYIESLGRMVGQIFIITKMTVYISTYIFIDNIKKKRYYLLLPLIPFIMSLILNSGRTMLMYYFIYIITLYYILVKQKKSIKNKKIINLGIKFLVIFFIFFLIYGKLGKRIGAEKIFYTLSIYIGSSLNAFNLYLERPIYSNNFGETTLYLFYNIVDKLGFETPSLYIPALGIEYGGFKTNIYTAIKRYYQDYRVLGVYIISVLLGAIYQYLYRIAKFRKGFITIFFASIYFVIFEFWIEERFFTSIISTSTIYNLFWLYVLKNFLCTEKIK